MGAKKELFNKNFINLFLGQLLTHLGDAAIQIILMAILINSVEKPGSLIAMMLFSFVFPSLIVSAFAGSIVDRFSRKKVMIFSSLYRGAVLILGVLLYSILLGDASLLPMVKIFGVVLSLLIGIGTAFLYPAKMAAVPNVVSVQTLKSANALVSGSGTLALTFGATLISAILVKVGILSMFYVTCALYFIAPLFLFGVQLRQDEDSDETSFDLVNDIKQTFSFLEKHKKALSMIIIAVVISLISAIFYNAMLAKVLGICKRITSYELRMTSYELQILL